MIEQLTKSKNNRPTGKWVGLCRQCEAVIRCDEGDFSWNNSDYVINCPTCRASLLKPKMNPELACHSTVGMKALKTSV